ncbi:MAG: SGNH/GDSL hydrolase family protein, partial [Pirellulales bacterium]
MLSIRPRAWALAWLAVSSTCSGGERPRDVAGPSVARAEFVATVLTPVWRATEIHEPIFFIDEPGSARPTGKLLFKPTEVLSITSGTRAITFEPAQDYAVDLANGTISLPPDSRIPVTTLEHLYPLMTSDLPKIARRSGDRTRGIFFDEGSAYHKLQVDVTYRCQPGQWPGPTPQYALESLPRTIAKFGHKRPVKLLLCGDSISTGANSSLFTNVPPHCPGFGALIALALESHFGSKVTFINMAIGGTTSADGLQLAQEIRNGKVQPDLVLMAFGMNDVYYHRDAAAFQANVRGMMDRIRADAPEVEFILVASMLANDERGMPMKQFSLNRDALAELCGPGVALADMTTIRAEMLKSKSYYDHTGNGVNHTNDFG